MTVDKNEKINPNLPNKRNNQGTQLFQEKSLKKQKLRNNEYYDMQSTFDELHHKATQNKTFADLISIIASENNILLAFRNIKNNKGSITAGTDGKDIDYYKKWSEEKFVRHFQNKLQNYRPKSVRRVEIPKLYQPDKTRPLGIPCMDDRIIQQCILQVLEPICEAQFHKHSYGFRPNRATSHAIARANQLMFNIKLHYVVDVDIKGFFDNVNHGKLIKQMWAMGIQDKALISIVGRILKSEIKGIGIPTKGTPQGGIISPLLSNIVLNELDWWLSDQWETLETKHPYTQHHKYRALKTTNLKEFYFVRYADDFKIFCKDYKTAQKIFAATKKWLEERLGLEISPEKSKITNVRKGKTEFLGLALFVKKKIVKSKNGNKITKWITRSNIQDKAIKAMELNLKEQVKVIQKDPTLRQVNKLNAMILGYHNYYQMATLCNSGFDKINFIVSKSLYNRLKGKLKRIKKVHKTKKTKGRTKKPEEHKYSKTYQRLYGDYNGKPKIIAKTAIFPIYGCKYKAPMKFTSEINSYTPQGRALIHSKLNNVSQLVRYLLNNKEYDKSAQYNDNRISLIAGQQGKCYVTGLPLETGYMECHHKKPKQFGGTDDYDNLMWLHSSVHKLIHSTQSDTISKYLQMLNLDSKALKKVNSLRLLAENLEIDSLQPCVGVKVV